MYDIRAGNGATWGVDHPEVVSTATVNNFKARLDRFWANEEIYYNYKANLSCTGSRSNYDVYLE